MTHKESSSEHPSDGRDDRQEEVARRLAELTSRKRGRVRWRMSKHTAEMALEALRADGPEHRGARGKQRRRKRHKRLL